MINEDENKLSRGWGIGNVPEIFKHVCDGNFDLRLGSKVNQAHVRLVTVRYHLVYQSFKHLLQDFQPGKRASVAHALLLIVGFLDPEFEDVASVDDAVRCNISRVACEAVLSLDQVLWPKLTVAVLVCQEHGKPLLVLSRLSLHVAITSILKTSPALPADILQVKVSNSCLLEYVTPVLPDDQRHCRCDVIANPERKICRSTTMTSTVYLD